MLRFVDLCIFIVWLPSLRFFRAFSTVVRQMPGFNYTGHDPHSSKIFVLFFVLFVLYRPVYCLCVNVYCTAATG